VSERVLLAWRVWERCTPSGSFRTLSVSSYSRALCRRAICVVVVVVVPLRSVQASLDGRLLSSLPSLQHPNGGFAGANDEVTLEATKDALFLATLYGTRPQVRRSVDRSADCCACCMAGSSRDSTMHRVGVAEPCCYPWIHPHLRAWRRLCPDRRRHQARCRVDSVSNSSRSLSSTAVSC